MRSPETPQWCGERVRFSLLTDAIDFSFDSEMIEGRQRQGEEEADSAIKMHESVAKSLIDLFRCASDGSGIWNPPMSGHRLARPNGTGLTCSVVAYGKNEIQHGGPGLGEFVPGLAAESRNRKLCSFQKL